MALTFLQPLLEQQSTSANENIAVTAPAAHRICTDELCVHERNEFYAEIISSLNEYMVEQGCCADETAQSLVEDEPLARREWKRLLDRVLSGPTNA